ncbi:MAG TPA: DEAD/DEAH box helicase family protein [Candidatus Paceibacterota bacterium]|nr:DEAD/DEAH box helicase family protein [Candidatus Paceibacterota bacterium]
MNINLKPYQEKAVDQLIAAVKGLLEREGVGEVCVFQAPTGSGKTVMTGKFIENLIKELPEEDLCFLWVSIGKGDLHLQSKHSLEHIFDGFPKVSLVEEEFHGGRDHIARNEVVVANWEKLRSKDRTTGDWKNILMKEGEKINFRDVLEKTREQRKIILIIDESHIGATAERTNELRTEINADVVVEMSATPRLVPTPADLTRGAAAYVLVEPKSVIEEGMIKKEIIINEGLGKLSGGEKDSQEVVLEAAYQKRLELKKAFDKEGANVNPLVLIQIPTAEAGEAKIQAVKEFLAKKGVTEKNRKLAIWLSEQKSETIDWISEPDNEIEFLIFKQAIDTGWDCPRAHILVKFREIRNEIFEVQTVGRILRMPEQKHYANEALNRGYIFTNLPSIEVKKEEYNPNIIKHLRATRIADYKPIKLVSYYKSRVDYGDITSSFMPVFEKTANEYFGIKGDHALILQAIKQVENKGVVLDLKQLEQEVIADTRLHARSFDELEGKITPEALARLTIAGNDLQAMFEQVIKNNLGSFRGVRRSVPVVKTAIYSWFRKYLGSKNWKEEVLLIQKVFLHDQNRPIFERILADAVERYRAVKESEVRKKIEESEQYYTFELPKELFFNEHTDELIKAKSYAYEPSYLNVDRSDPERRFEKFLNDNADKITWWWKNGENKQDYFGIRYEYAGGIYAFYPDYLVQLKDGRLGIFEVKDVSDRDGKTTTKAKAEALQAWLAKQKRKDLFGGIVIERNRTWLINSKSTYNWGKCERGDWSEWEKLEF